MGGRGPTGLNRQQRLKLGTMLRSVVDMLNPVKAGEIDAESIGEIPVTVILRLEDEIAPGGASYETALADLSQRLLDEEAQLTDQDMEVVVRLAKTAGSEAAQVFRRMVRD